MAPSATWPAGARRSQRQNPRNVLLAGSSPTSTNVEEGAGLGRGAHDRRRGGVRRQPEVGGSSVGTKRRIGNRPPRAPWERGTELTRRHGEADNAPWQVGQRTGRRSGSSEHSR